MSAPELILYTSPNCRLCNEAEQLLYEVGIDVGQFRKVDVTKSLVLKKNYGLKIPVLHRVDSGAELFWPFDLEGLTDFLS